MSPFATPQVTPRLDEIIPSLAEKQVVFIGETHDRYEHHLVQLEIIRRLHAVHPEMVIGVEFLQRPFQDYLDAFIQGDLGEQTFLKKTEYFRRWGFDYRLYRPILDYARQHRIPVLALNVPTEILRRVAQVGLEGLNAEEKVQIPREIDLSDTAYRERLRESYRLHGRGDDTKGFERFWQAQLLWDETMSETAADYLKRYPSRRMVILAGSGHLTYGSGIPQRLIRRLPVTTAIVINAEPTETTDPNRADYLLVPEKVALPPAGQLGIAMEKGSPVRIQEVKSGGGAAEAKLQRGDQIVAIDAQKISEADDIQIALLDKRPGDSVNLTIYRERKSSRNKEFSVTVRLSAANP